MTSLNLNENVPSHKKLDANFEQDETNFCLICSSEVQVSADIIEKETTGRLSKNLAVIFLLKNLLQLPDAQLEKNLKEYGDPVNWISLCENCSQLTSKALHFHCQIVKLDRELWSIQQLVVEKVKNTATLSSLAAGEVQQFLSLTRNQVRMRTRDFIKNSKLNSVSTVGNLPQNPFIEGDKLALKCQHEMLAASKNVKPSSPVVKIEVKTDILSDHEVDGDIEWNQSEVSQREDVKPNITKARKRRKRKPKPPTQKHVVVNGKMKCNYCDKEFFNKLACYKHEQDEHSSKISGNFICDLCGKIVGTQEKLVYHKYHVHKLKFDGTPMLVNPPQKSIDDDDIIPPTCKTCLKTFKTVKILMNHVKIVHERRLLYSCQLCGKRFRGSVHMKTHMLQVHKDDPLTKQLEEEGIRLWKCKQMGCSAIFLQESSLEAHYKKGKHKNNKGDKFICEICGKSYTTKHDYLKHKKGAHKLEEEMEMVVELV